MNTNIDFAGIKMKNPVTVASGTFSYGEEFAEFFDLSKLGGIFTKGTSLLPRAGNKPPRVCESPSGMLNAIGLQNPGIEYVVEHYLPTLKKYDTAIIVNAIGNTIEEYVEICKILNKTEIDGVEINLSCPNVKEGCMAFGISYDGVKEVTKAVRKILDKPLIVKLSPNVTDITQTAKAAQDAGADGVSLINSFTAMVIDIETRRPVLANNTGGLSGPGIRPIAVRMTYDVAQKIDIPIIGIGGIIEGSNAIEFMLAGAKVISVGTGNFYSPDTSIKVIEEIEEYLIKHKIEDINSIIGTVKMN